MRFLINTPQTVGHHVAMQESRKAAKRKATHRSEMELAAKKQKLLHDTMPPAPAESQTCPTPSLQPAGEMPMSVDAFSPQAQAQAQAHNATELGPTPERPKLADTSLPPAQAEHHEIQSPEPSTKKRNADHCSIPQAREDEVTDVEPATKKPRLSYASLPPARVRDPAAEAERDHYNAELNRRQYRRLCEYFGYDYSLLDQSVLSDEMISSPAFDIHRYMAAQSSEITSSTDASPDPNHDLPAEGLTNTSPAVDAHVALERKGYRLSRRSPAPDTATQLLLVSNEVTIPDTPAEGTISRENPDSGDGTSDPLLLAGTTPKASLAFDGRANEVCSPLDGQASTSLSSTNSKPKVQLCSSSNSNEGHSTTPASLDPIASVNSGREIENDGAAVSSDKVSPLPLDVHLRDDSTPASLSQNRPADPPRNKGGRPRGRKPRARKTPKGPTRFQKNHPVKAMVNVDVWENILLYCPPDFLLKARQFSPTFRSVLKDDSLIWKRARVKHFGSDMPDPPAGLSEPQYADLLTGTGCQTRGCQSKKSRKTYWAFQRRLCIECFQNSFLPPRALKRVFKELETSNTPQYRSIAQYYQNMDEFLPGMKFDRWDNYQWLGNYDPTPSWGQRYRSGQYTGYPAAAYADFSSEVATLIGNEYDAEHGRFSSGKPMPGKTCAPQDTIDAWFDTKRAANDDLMPELQAVENWCESYKRENQKVSKDVRKNRESFYEEQAELAGWNKAVLQSFKSYQAAIAISKPATIQSWNILQPKITAEYEKAKQLQAEIEVEKRFQKDLALQHERERERELFERARVEGPGLDWDFDDIVGTCNQCGISDDMDVDAVFNFSG